MSSPNQPPDPSRALDDIKKQLSELEEKIAALRAAYAGLPGELVADQKQFLESVKAKSQSNTPAWIAAAASIAAVVIAIFGSLVNGQMISQTNAALTRFTTFQSEIAKKDSDIYYVAHDQIAGVQQEFETFLLEKKLTQQASRFGNDLNRMCTANRFKSKTAVVREYDDFIFETIFALQHIPARGITESCG